MVVTPQAITFHRSQSSTVPVTTTVLAITRVTTEGRKVIAHTVDTRPERRGHPIGYVFRWNKQWLLVSKGTLAEHSFFRVPRCIDITQPSDPLPRSPDLSP